MTVTFYSNYLNHHQIPFCDAMYGILGDGFKFVESEPMETERKDLGWGFTECYPYCIKAHESAENYENSLALAADSDIIIHGSAPEIYMQIRIKSGKPAFRYSERFFKRGFWRILHPRAMAMYFWRNTRLRGYPLYMLCASAYTAYDCARIFAHPKKCYRWGYFPRVKEYDAGALSKLKTGRPVKLLWVGRFLDWKHPEAALEAARHLSAKNIDYTLDFIGRGEEFEQICEAAGDIGGQIGFLGAMKPDEVRGHMERADIFMFTSDFQEGWGAVLNEAMNSGCAVVASHAIGSAPFLIRHGVNGFMYESGNTGMLCAYVERLAADPRLRHDMGEAAYRTIADEWNPRTAAQRLTELCHAIAENRRPSDFDSGPCGRAAIISNKYSV